MPLRSAAFYHCVYKDDKFRLKYIIGALCCQTHQVSVKAVLPTGQIASAQQPNERDESTHWGAYLRARSAAPGLRSVEIKNLVQWILSLEGGTKN